MIERELKDPGENLLGSIIRVARAEGIFDQVTAENIIVTLIVAGYDTTIWMLAAAMTALLICVGAALARLEARLGLSRLLPGRRRPSAAPRSATDCRRPA